MRLQRALLTGVLLLLLLLLGLEALATPAGASSERLVHPGRLLVLSSVFGPLPSLPRPEDGRLRGYGFSAEVTGDECAGSISGAGEALRSTYGYEVCALRFSIDFSGAPTTTVYGQPIPAFSARVDAGGKRLFLSSNDVYSASSEEIAVAVRKGAPASLVMSAAGYGQSFSLVQGRRTGTSPPALYRSASGDEVTSSPGSAVTIKETAVPGGAKASVRIRLSSLTLGWFMPGDPLVRPSSESGAFLGLSFSETDLKGPGGVRFTEFAPLPGSSFRLGLPDKTAVPATSVGAGPLGLVDSTYVFPVPAALGKAVVAISPGTRLGYEESSAQNTAALAAAKFVEVRFGTGSVALSVPDPLPTSPSPLTTTTTTTTTGGTAGSGTGGTVQAGKQQHKGKKGKTDQKKQKHLAGANGPTPTTNVPIALSSGARRGGSTTLLAACGAAAGTTLIVIPLVIVLRRRRRGRRLFLRVGKPRPQAEKEPSAEPGAAANGSEATAVAETPPVLFLRVLGPITLDELADCPRRPLVVELCAYLVLNAGRDVPADELCNALGGAKSDWSPSTLYQRVSTLRKALGRNVVVRSGKFGYRIEGEVACDWASFSELTGRKALDPKARIAELGAALELVRGVPFTGTAAGRYEWALSSLSHEMTSAIEGAALELSSLLIEKKKAREAAAAVVAGRRGVPYSFGLEAQLLRAGALEGPGGLERAWREVVSHVGVDEELKGLKERLAAATVGA